MPNPPSPMKVKRERERERERVSESERERERVRVRELQGLDAFDLNSWLPPLADEERQLRVVGHQLRRRGEVLSRIFSHTWMP
jgi:hypothetical protein